MDGLDMNDTYGSMLIGTFFAIFFQGLLSVQAYVYYESFPDDPIILKTLVAVVWTLDLAHLVLICQTVYHYLITNFGNQAALLLSTEPLDLHLIFVGAATILCQGYFLTRVHSFSRQNWLLTGLLGLACLATLAVTIRKTVLISLNKSVASFAADGREILVMFALAAVVDLIMAMLLVYYLSQGRTGSGKTNFVIIKIMQYTVATGLATSLLAIAAVAAYVMRPNSFVYIAIHFSLGRMYTNAVLVTLNSRRGLRNVLGIPSGSSRTAPVPMHVSVPEFTVSQTGDTDYPLTKLVGKCAD